MVGMVNRERILEEFLEMVRIDSPSGREKEMVVYLKEKLTGLGLEVVEDGAGEKLGTGAGNIVATLPATDSRLPALFFSAHLDTVEPGCGIEPVVDGEVVRSAGDTILGGDDKAGIAAILEMLRVVQEEKLPHGVIQAVFTVMEEQGLRGALHLDRSLLKAEMGFVLDCDGPPGTLIIRAPAQNKIEAFVVGKAAHAGIAPEEGINAIAVAAKAIALLPLGRIDSETTANVGIIEGGKAINIVPDMVRILGEVRSLDGQKLDHYTEKVKEAFFRTAAEHGARAEVKVEFLYPAFSLQESDPPVALAVRAARALGLEPVLKSSGGGSDANYFNHYGIPTVNLGIGMSRVHTTDEYIKIADLEMNARYLLEIVKTTAEK